MIHFLRRAVPGLLLVASLGGTPDPWTQLKIGMAPAAVTSLLGSPFVQTRGHGIEIWIYEHGGEVVVCGRVTDWTAPARSPRAIPAKRAPLLPPLFPALPPVPVPIVPTPKPASSARTEVILLPTIPGKSFPARP